VSDNTTLNPGSGGDIVRSLDKAGVKTSVVALDLNPAGSETLMSGSMPTTSADGGHATIGTTTDASSALTLVGLLKAIKAAVTGVLSVAQSGTWTVQPGNTANTTAWKVDGSAVTQPVSGTVSITSNSSVNQAQIAGTATDVNSGNKSAGTQRVVLATDQPQLTNALKVDGSAVTQPVSGTVTANPADATPVLKNGLTNSASSVISSQAARLTSYYLANPGASAAYVQVFDVATAGAVTLGTTTPKWSIWVPAGAAANLAGLSLSFANGIQVAATTTATGSSAPATALDCNFGYR
jgi:hypothetical protein